MVVYVDNRSDDGKSQEAVVVALVVQSATDALLGGNPAYLIRALSQLRC
jgi:hypothetical protein